MNYRLSVPRAGRIGWLLCASVVCLATVVVARAQTPTARSVWDGVYTQAQAADGEAVFLSTCAECHGEDLAGREQAPALAGVAFLTKWNHATLKRLYDTMEDMPPDAPKSLDAADYVKVLAYLLRANEFPAGEKILPVDRGALAAIEISSTRPAK
jgi:mono/diheme cytochrome c family protein